MFERTKVFSKKSSLRDKIHQNPPSMRDFSVFNRAMRNFYCTFAPVLERATNRVANISTKLAEIRGYRKLKNYTNKWF